MTPLLQAEQAVLGGVLLEPGQLDRLTPWLRPEHFYRPTHAALYTALLDLHAEGHPATTTEAEEPVPVSWVNDTQARTSSQAGGVTAAYVHSLAAACPRPTHTPVYGRMVLEGAIHRTVAQHAIRLNQSARADAVRADGVAETLHHAQILTDVLDDLAQRWGTHPRPAPTGTPPAAAPPAAGEKWNERVLGKEELFLGALTAHPHQMGEVVGWLRDENFADPAHRQIYRALAALHHRSEPVDQLTVLWECQRRGALTGGTLDADRVRRLCDTPPGGAADYFGERLLDASLLRTAAASARQVRDLADDDALAPGQLINQAARALGPLEEIRRRRDNAAAGPGPEDAGKRAPAGPPPARTAAARACSPATPTAPTTPPTPATPSPPASPRPPRRSPS